MDLGQNFWDDEGEQSKPLWVSIAHEQGTWSDLADGIAILL